MNFQDFVNLKIEILTQDQSHLNDLGDPVSDVDHKIFRLACLADEIGRVAWSVSHRQVARELAGECRLEARRLAASAFASSNGKKGGAATSAAKSATARANGAKGGRPKVQRDTA